MADATATGTTDAGSAAADGPAGKKPCDCKCECPCSPTTLWTDYVLLASVEDPSPRAMALPLPERRPSTTALYDLVTPPRGVLMPMADMTEEVQGSSAASWGQWAGRSVAYDVALVLPDQLVLGASAGRYGDVLGLPPPGRPGWRRHQGGTLAAAPGGFVGAAAPAAAGGWERPDRGGDARSAGPAGQFQQLTIQRTEQEQHRLDAQRSMDAVTAPALAKMAALSPGGKAAATSGLAAAQRFEGFSDTLRPAMGEIQRTTDALAAQVGVSRDMLPMGPGPAASTLPGHGTDPFAPIDVQAQKGTEAYAQAGLAAQSRVTQEPNAASDYRALQDRMRAATQLLQARGGSGFAAGGPSGEASYQQTPGSTEAPAGGGFGVAPAASAPAADGLTASSATTPASSSASSASGEPPSAAAAQSASLTASAAAESAPSAAPASSTIHASPTATAPSSEPYDEHVTAYDLDTVRPAADHRVGDMLRAESATSGRDALVADASGFVHDLANPDTVAEPVGQSAGGSQASLPSLPRKGQVLRPEGSSGPGLDASAPLGAAGDRGIMSVDAGASRAAGPDLGLAPASGRSAGIALPSTGTAGVAPRDPFGLSLGAAASAEDDARTLGIGGPGLGREGPARLPEQVQDDRIAPPLGGGGGASGVAFDDDVARPIGEVGAETRSGASEVDLGAFGAYAGGPGIGFADGPAAATGFASSAGASPWGTRADGSGQYGVSNMSGTDVSLLDREQVSRPGKRSAPLGHYAALRNALTEPPQVYIGTGEPVMPEAQRHDMTVATARQLLREMYASLHQVDDDRRGAIIDARGRKQLIDRLTLDVYLDRLKQWKENGKKGTKPNKDDIEQEISDIFDEAERTPEPADPPPPPEGGVPAALADACGCEDERKRCEETCPVPCICAPSEPLPDDGSGTDVMSVRGTRLDLGPDALYEGITIQDSTASWTHRSAGSRDWSLSPHSLPSIDLPRWLQEELGRLNPLEVELAREPDALASDKKTIHVSSPDGEDTAVAADRQRRFLAQLNRSLHARGRHPHIEFHLDDSGQLSLVYRDGPRRGKRVPADDSVNLSRSLEHLVRLLSGTYPHILLVGNGFIYTSPADPKTTLGATFAPAQPEDALGNIIVNVDARDEYEAQWADAGEARIPDPQDAVALLYHELVEAKYGNTRGVSSKQAHELGLKFEDQFRSEEGLPRRMTQEEFDEFNDQQEQEREKLDFSRSTLSSRGRELPSTLTAAFTYDLPGGEAVVVQHVEVDIYGATRDVRTDVTRR